jgi:hypothetical protein
MDRDPLTTACLATVREALPAHAHVELEAWRDRAGTPRLAGVLRLRAGPATQALPVAARTGKCPRAGLEVLGRRFTDAPVGHAATAEGPPWMLFAEYVPPVLGRHLREARQPFADACGNVFLWGVGLYVWVEGHKPTGRPPRPPRLTRAAAAKVLYVLLQEPDRVRQTYRQVATCAGVAPDTVLSVFSDLRGKRYLIEWGRRKRRLERLPELMELWLQAYQDGLRHKLHPTRCVGVGNDPIPWKDLVAAARPDAPLLVGGETAAYELTGTTRPEVVTLHVPAGTQTDVMRTLRLVPHAQGATTLLDTFGRANGWIGPLATPTSLPFADPLLIHAELMLTGNDRLREAAEELYRRHIVVRFT